MFRFSVYVLFLNSIICSMVISAASTIPSATPFPPPICTNGEVLSDCYSNNCLRRYCVEEEPEPDCERKVICLAGCLCQEGYLRALNGTCIPYDMCSKPKVCGENEIYSECSNDECLHDDCSELWRVPLFCADIIGETCIPGCICINNHFRNASGTCVPLEECPKNEICSEPNEYYDPCPPSCPQRDCGHNDSEATCPPQPKEGDPSCYPSCRCKEGFYEKYSYIFADCVPREYCSKTCSGRNELFVPYPKTCEPQTCDIVNDTYVLQSANITCECQCYPGFVRNKHGKCIEKDDCGKCLGLHEYFGCEKSCDNVCATLHKTNQTECTDDIGLCLYKCYCDEGYARDANNICIPIADCPTEK